MTKGKLNANAVMDLIEKERELILTIPYEAIDATKSRLSQAKHKRGITERMTMSVMGPAWEYLDSETDDGSVRSRPAADLHIKLGEGADIEVLGWQKVDAEL